MRRWRLQQGGLVLHPVAGIAIEDAVDFVDGRLMRTAAGKYDDSINATASVNPGSLHIPFAHSLSSLPMAMISQETAVP